MLDLPRQQWTLPELVRAQGTRQGERVFCSFDDASELTFRELDEGSDRIAAGLADLGVEPGDRVLALLHNSKAFLLALVGTQKRGAVFVPVNTELKGAFLEHQLTNSEPRVVMTEPELRGAFDSVSFASEGLRRSLTATVAVGGEVAALPGTRVLGFDRLLATPPRSEALVEVRPRDINLIMYTSGTTGPSKGVLMAQAHTVLFGIGLARRLGLTEEDRYYICMPLFHANALLMQWMGALLAGTPAYVVKRFSVSRWLDDVRSSGATFTNALGVMPEFIYRSPPSEHDRDHRLKAIMAVPIGDWGEAFEARFGVRLVQGYGMTECNIPAYGDPSDPVIPGCAGPILDEYFEVQIVEPETDEPLPSDQVGEIVVRPRLPWCFMQGYFRMPEKTVEAWRNFWFHTGDAGRIDARGRLHFVDRIKDCIRRRGENISSFEIEQVLNAHPAVAESAVIGVRVEGAGGEEEVKACIVPAGDPPDPKEILDWCVPRMPRYAVPRFIEFVSGLEKTQSGKIRKPELREAGVTPATWDREAAGYAVPR